MSSVRKALVPTTTDIDKLNRWLDQEMEMFSLAHIDGDLEDAKARKELIELIRNRIGELL